MNSTINFEFTFNVSARKTNQIVSLEQEVHKIKSVSVLSFSEINIIFFDRTLRGQPKIIKFPNRFVFSFINEIL